MCIDREDGGIRRAVHMYEVAHFEEVLSSQLRDLWFLSNQELARYIAKYEKRTLRGFSKMLANSEIFSEIIDRI